jgi:hypothetical protein
VPGKHHDLVNFTKKYKGSLHSFFLDMKSWKKFKTRFKLHWKKTRFDAAGHAAIPQERGIYAFTVELAPTKLPPHGYICTWASRATIQTLTSISAITNIC